MRGRRAAPEALVSIEQATEEIAGGSGAILNSVSTLRDVTGQIKGAAGAIAVSELTDESSEQIDSVLKRNNQVLGRLNWSG